MSQIEIPIDAKVLYQMYEYAAFAKHYYASEIAGWGHYDKDKGIYKLAPLTKQEVSGAEVDNFPNEILSDTEYNISDMIVQWHSHVDMGVTPSVTDINTIKETLKITPALISIIVNCKNEYTARLDFARANVFNLPNPVTFPIKLIPYYVNKEISREVKKKLSLPKPKTNDVSSAKDNYSYWEGGVREYWDSSLQMFVPLKEDKGQSNLIQLSKNEITAMDLDIAISKIIGIAKENIGEFEYCPSSSNNGLGDLLIHIPTGDFLSIDDFSVNWGTKSGGVSIVDEFVKHTKGKGQNGQIGFTY